MINTSSFLQQAIEEQLSAGNRVTLKVTGSSMRPYLLGNGNERVVISKHKPEELKPGVIILFLYNNRYVFHRIVRKMNETFLVQGDGNCIGTEEIETESVLGIVRYVIRNGKKKASPYSLTSRIYWRLWYMLRPIRKYLLLIYNRLQK